MGPGPQDDRETGKGEEAGKDPAGDTEGHHQGRSEAENDEPNGEKPEAGKAQPSEENTPEDSVSETDEPGTGQDADTADPGTYGLEEAEDPEADLPPETTDATKAEATRRPSGAPTRRGWRRGSCHVPRRPGWCSAHTRCTLRAGSLGDP